jgi:S1-C subfamily serine protease
MNLIRAGLTVLAASLLAGEALSADLQSSLGRPIEGTKAAPSAAPAGKAPVKLILPPAVAAKRLGAVLDGVASRQRGAREERIFSELSPAVVLVVTSTGIGSGSIVGQDGTILTSWHVIEGADDVGVITKPADEGHEVTRADLRSVKVVRVDEVADLALLRMVDVPKDLRVVPIGKAASLKVGEDVHAIGHPTGEMWTYTKGYISQLRAKYTWSEGEGGVSHSADVIQTQTPINPGNSGGPLFDDDGRLVGVNAFKAVNAEGLNFAVSVHEVERFLRETSSRTIPRPPAAAPSPASATGPGTASTCRPVYKARARSDRWAGDVAGVDIDCDGHEDGVRVTPDDKHDAIFALIDLDGDGDADAVFVDRDRDGRWDESLIDSNGDGKPDLRGSHATGEFEPTTVEPYTASK